MCVRVCITTTHEGELAYIHTCIYTHTRACIHKTCIYTDTNACIHTYMHIHIHKCMHTYIYAYTHTQVHAYVHAYIDPNHLTFYTGICVCVIKGLGFRV